MRIVVAGSTGKTGVFVVQELSKAGHNVVAITRDPEGKGAKQFASLPGVVVRRLEDAFDQPLDRAYIASQDITEHFIEETDFINNARKAGVKYIVKLSTFADWMTPHSEIYFARTHLAVEYFLEHGDVPFTCLRPNWFYNSIFADLESVPKTKQFKTPLDETPVAAIDSADVGRAAAALLLLDDPSPHYGKKYIMSGPEDINIKSVQAALSEALKTDIAPAGNFSEQDYKGILRALGLPESKVQSKYEGVVRGLKFLKEGKGSLANYPTSPEILALAPPKTTFRDFLQRIFTPK